MKSQSYASFMTDSAKLRVHSSWRLILGLSILAILALSTISFYQPRLGLSLSHSRTIGATAFGPAISADPPVTTGLFRTWGGPYYDVGRFVAVDNAGNIVMTGTTNSFGTGPPNVFIVKYGTSGNLLWQKTWGTTGYVSLAGAGLDSQGSVYFAVSNGSYTGPRILVVKFDSSGSLLWQKAWGGPSEYISGFKVDASGNSYFTGYSYSFNPRAFTVKLDNNGNLLWQKTWGRITPSGYDVGVQVAVDSSGNVYVTGYTSSFPIGNRYQSVFILKLDSMGNLQWQKTWNSDGNYDSAQAIAADPSSGNIYVSGYSSGPANARMFLLKIDSFGNIVWPRIWLQPPSYGAGAIASDSSGNIYLASQSYLGSLQVALAKIAASGNLLWQVAWGGFYNTAIPGGLAVDSDGNLVLTGEVEVLQGQFNFTALNAPFLSSFSNIATPSGSLVVVNSSVSTITGTVTTPSGSSTYSGGGDAFILTVPSAGPTNIAKALSSISLSVASLKTIVTGGSVQLSGIITYSPTIGTLLGNLITPLTSGNVTLTYVRPDGSSINRTVTFDSAGYFSDTFSPDKSGLWQVHASWSGNPQINGAQSALQSFEVQDAPSFVTTNLPWLILAGVVGGFLVAMVLTKPKGPKAS